MNGSKRCITSKNKTTLYLVNKAVTCSSHQPIKLGAYFNCQNTDFLLANIQIWIDFLRADMSKKMTIQIESSLVKPKLL